MEGDGEGLVAIVQGLDPAGVTLTVCNRSRHNTDRRRSSRPRIQINAGNAMLATDQRSHTLPENSAPPANQRSSVDTYTGADFSKQHTSSQICDGRYASSYKLAHCMVTPTSPPEAVSEFPPQRKEPCRNQGNFEIGGHGSGQWNCHASGQGTGHSSGKVRDSTSRVRHYGGSQTWVEKGSSHRYCKSNRDTEAFAHSLRKYPSMAPFRTASTDLIEKLIRYTQAKNFQEMSRSTKSMRSLRQQKSSDTYEVAKASKDQQTYTRTRQDDNVINNSKVQVGSRVRTRNFKLYSPVSNNRNLKATRQTITTFSSSYDYLKAANSPYGRSNRSDESPSPVESSSPERTRSPEKFRSPEGCKSPEVSRSPVRFKSTDGLRSPYKPYRSDRSILFERSVRDLSLSDMSKYIRSSIRQIGNESPVVFQACPKLKNRFNQHKKVCPHKNDRASDIMEDEPEEDQASGSVLSRLIQSFSGCAVPSTEQTGCQCNRTDCHCTKATQCVNNPDASTNTTTCSCKTPTKTGCCRGMSCVCANKAQGQVYYKKRIDEEISEWLKDVPVHSIECSNSNKRRETVIKKLRNTLKQLPYDENFDDNARNEIKRFIDNFSQWNPAKDKEDEKLLQKQLADKLIERIVGIPRKPDRFTDIVKKWVVNMDFKDNGEDVDKATIISKFVNKLKSLAVERPSCDIKYTKILRKEIIELLVELALKSDGDMIMLKNIANKLATEIVSIPRNVNLPGNTIDLTDEFEENVSDWICEHGLCGELNEDPKLIESLAKKLNKLKSHGIDDCVFEKINDEIHQFVDDVGIAIEIMNELVNELMKELSNTVQTNEMERQRQQNNDKMMIGQDELTEEVIDWLSDLPGASDLHPRKFEKIINELVNVIKEGREQGYEDLTNDILNFLVDADLPIEPNDLVTHVEELMETPNILLSDKYRREQAKKVMLKGICEVIENMSISEDKKAELRKKAHEIVGRQLHESSLNSKGAHDDVEEATMNNMDVFISSIDIPKESLFKLKTSLSNTLNNILDESLTRLRRLSRDVSNLKLRIAKHVRNTVMGLPIDTDKNNDLLQQVKGTLSKNMHKPLAYNVKNTINNEISDIVDKCPISEDNSIVGCLKKMLSAVASKHLNIFLPKCVCDIQSKAEKDIGIVIDRSSIDAGKQNELKDKIHDILTENEDRHLSDEVLRTIKKDINGVVGDLSIPQDKKDVLKKIVGETISEGFNAALSNLRHDLNEIRNKLFEDICNVIEKSPIAEVVKTHLINNLKSVLAKHLDSSFLDEDTILDEVSNIVKEDMPEEKRRSLTNKLAKKLDTQQSEEDTNEIDQLRTKNLKQLEKKILVYILREMEQAVEEAPIPRVRKIELKKKLKDMATIDYKKTAKDISEAVRDGINQILDELHLPKGKKNELKNELAAAIDEYSKLLRDIQDLETEYGEQKYPTQELDVKKAKGSILQGIEDVITESAIPEDKKMELTRELKKLATSHLKKPFSDDVQDPIKIGIADILDELQIPKSENDKLKRALLNMADENLVNLREAKQPVEEVDETNVKESILQGIEKIFEESAMPEEKKKELKRKLKKNTVDNLKKPFIDDVQDAIKFDIADILNELRIPKSEKDKLKHALINMADKNLEKLQGGKQPVEEVDEITAKESILQGIEKTIEESAIPEDKKMELTRELKKMATDHLKKPFSDNVQDAIKIGIADILDELHIPKSEKYKLKRALINMADKNLANLRDDNKTKAKESILQGIEKITEESAIPEEKKKELKTKLKKMAVDNLKKLFSDNVQDAIKIGISDILDELQIPKSEKDKLKRALLNMADENLVNLREAKQPVEEVDKITAKESTLQGIEKIIEETAIPEEKKKELKRKLKKMATDNLKKPFSDEVQDAIKIGIADILDELQIPKSLKDKLNLAILNMADENLANLRDVDKTIAKESILQGIEEIAEESAIPEEKKNELKRKLKKMTVDHSKKPFSEDVQDAIKIAIVDILDELQIPISEKDKLKRALLNMADENLVNLREAKQPADEVDEITVKESILQGIEKIIEESAIPEEKKKELKRILNKMATDNLKRPFSDDVQGAIKIGIADILDELKIPTSVKDKLTRALLNMADENLEKLREAKQPVEDIDETNAKESIWQGIEKITEESAISEEKKKELERKLKRMAVDNFKKSFSDDVQDAIKIGIVDILDELKIPKFEKDKLTRALLNMADENLEKLHEAKQPVEDVNETNAKESILQGIEKIIEESAIPEDKKKELKRILNKMATDNLKRPFSDDVQGAIKIGIADILDELKIPTSVKDKLTRALLNMADENLEKLREAKQPVEDVDETNAKESIWQGIEKITEESAISEEKKKELERKLKRMAVDNLKKTFSDDVQDAIKIGIVDILDELKIPKFEKDKLTRALLNMADENLEKLHEAKQPVEDVNETNAKKSILQGIEKIIEKLVIPEEKKKELKRKLEKLTDDNLKKPFSDDVQDAIKIGIADILDELKIPKSVKDTLTRALLNMADENLANLREKKQSADEVDEITGKESILQGIQKIIKESAIPKDKKMELTKELEKMATDHLKKPFSDDVQDAIRIGIADILDELQIPKTQKNELKHALLNMADENLVNLREAKQPVDEVDEITVKESILQGIEKIIEESAIPEEKKMELKRILNETATDNLKRPFSDDVQDAIKIGIADILDELKIPKSVKDKLTRALLNMADENLANFREKKQSADEVDEITGKESILQGIQKIIKESAIPKDKKMELTKELKKMATDHLKKPFSDDVQDAIRIGIADILDELKIPKSVKDKLTRALLNMADENLEKLREAKQPVEDIDETNAKESIWQGIEKITEESAISEEKKKELERKLKRMAVDNLKKTFSDDVQDAIKIGIVDILDELKIPKFEKDKLTRALLNMADENLEKLHEAKQPVEDVNETNAKESILQGIEKIIEKLVIPEEKKKELKMKLEKLTDDNLKKPFSDDVQDAIKIGIADILDELKIPKSVKDTLTRALLNMADENLANLREKKQSADEVDEITGKESILQGIQKIIKESAIPKDKKMELTKELEKMATDHLKKPFSDDVQDAIRIGIADILDELQIPKTQKDELKHSLLNMADENLANLRDVDKTIAKESILQGIEEITKESAIPEEKKKKLKRKLEKLTDDNLKKPYSNVVQDVIKIGIVDILDKLQIPKSEKDKLKRALLNIADENMVKLQETKQPADEVDEITAKESILQGIEKIIEESAIPEEKKKELKKKLEKLTDDNLKKPYSNVVQDVIKIGIVDILDKLQIPKSEKDKLKRALLNIADENMVKLQETKQPADEVDEITAKESILQGIEKIIEESAIPEEKKKELKKKLEKLTDDNLKKPYSNVKQDVIKIGISDILDELQIPKSEKDKLNRALLNMADENMVNLREAKQPVEEVDEITAKESILQGIEKIIEVSAFPEEKKKEMKRKLKKMATDNLEKPFSDDVQDAIKMGIADTLDELQIPKTQKDKLKRALLNMADENLTNLRDVDKTIAKESILQGIEEITEESAIPEEKKKELKRKLEKLTDDNLKKPFSDDVQDAIKIGIVDILDELQIPLSENDKLKRALLNMADGNLVNLQETKQPADEVDETNAKESILQGIERIIEESAISEEKKKELKRKLKKITVDNLKKPFSDDVQDAIRIGIVDILDELQIPKSEKDKLNRALLNMADENMVNLREAKQPVEEVDEITAKESILQGIEEITEESAIPEKIKKELKRKLKIMADDNLKKPFSDDVQDAIKIGIADILDELQIPKSEKDKLKRVLINMTDDYLDNMRDVDKTKAKESIFQGIEEITKESAIPEEKKKELKRKLKKMNVDNLKKPFSDNVQDAIKIGIADILDELQIPKSEKDKLKRVLINMTDDYLDNMRDVDKTKAKESIFQGIEEITKESAIPEEKRKELKRKLKKMNVDNLKKPFSDDVQDAIKIGIADILDELKIPKSEKDKLKRVLLNMADENLAKLQEAKQPEEEVYKTKAKESILQGIEKTIKESAIPEDKKMEFTRKLKKMATDHLKKPFSDDVQDAIKIGIADILDELQTPKSEKDKLKRALINMTDDYLDNLGKTKQVKLSKGLMPIEEVDEINAKESILQGIEKIIEESAIPENKKMELKRKLKKNAVDTLKKPFTDDVHDAMKIGIADILDELQIPYSENNKLKHALLNMVDENVDNLRGVTPKLSSQLDDFKELENETKNNILFGLEKAIDEAPIPIDKKKESKKKLKDLATKNFQKSLSDDTAAALKDGVYEILDELNLQKDKKNKLKSELTAAADDNLSYFKNEINLAKSMPDAKRHKLNVIIRRVLPQFDEAVDPSYQKQLAEEFDELLEIAGTDGDFKDARRKLIKKLMREQNLSEKDASGPVDELIGRAREMALKQDIGDESYELDPSYVKTLEADINGLVNIAQVGGDFEEARRKLTNKLMREQNLPEEKASACADELIGKAQKLALASQSKDKTLLHKEALAKAISDAVDQSNLSKPDTNSLKNKLLRKLKQTMDQKRFINIDDLKPLKSGVLKDLKKIVDVSSIPTDKKNELKLSLNEELANTIDGIMDEYDVEEGYTKSYTKAISNAVNKSHIPNLKKSNLKKALAKVFDGALDDSDDDKITKDKETFSKSPEILREDKLKKYKEAFAGAINDAVSQSTLSKPDKSGQKNKLLSKLNEIIDKSSHINDIVALTDEVLKYGKKIVDTLSIPIDKKTELKVLLEKAMTETAKELMNDEEVSQVFAIFKDKLAEIVKTWMDSLPIDLDPKVATAAAKDLASDILDRQKYLQLHPEAISSDKDEIENLKYQIFRRIKSLVDSKDISSMEGAEELYKMVMEIEPPQGFPKLREQSTSEWRRKDPVFQDIDGKKSISTTLSTGNINYSLKELIATSKSIRRQWSKNLDEEITKLPLPTNEKSFFKEKLAIYDETDQINMLSTKSKDKEENCTVQVTKSKKPVALKPAQVGSKVVQIAPKAAQKNYKEKPSSRFSKIEKALTFNTTKQKSPFTPKSNQGGNEKEFSKFTTNTINAWLDKVHIEPKAKTRIVEELTNDIVHRKIYLQIYGSLEPSRSDDLENLKLQVHRRLNKFVPAEVLKAVIADTKQLLAKIDNFKIKITPESANKPKSPVFQKTNKKQGIANILDVKGKATNTPMNMNEEEMEQELSNTEFSPGQTSTPGKPNAEPTAEENKIIVAESIRTWIESMPIDLETDAKTDFIYDLTNDIVDRNKYLQVLPDKTISKKEEIENLRFQVYKRLIKADPDASEIPDIEKIEELYKMIGHGRRKSLTPKQTEEFLIALNEETSAILDEYYIGCDRRELHPSLVNELKKLGKSNADQDDIVENLIEIIKRLTYMSSCMCDEEAEELAHKLLYRTKKLIARIQEKYTPVKKKDFKEAMMQDIGDVFSGCPMSKEKRKLMESQLAEEYAKDLGIPLEDSDVTIDGTGPESKKERYGMSFNGLTNFIDTWLSSIHTDDDTKKEVEIKDMAYSLIHKIGEMNVDPEIFNDDSLYEAVLRDELQNLLGDITISDDEIQTLIEKVLEAQHRAHDEIAGQTYKRKLRDTISKLLPDQRNLSNEEQASIETLKDQLADAYIDLHYSGDNENQRERLKRKIADEINNFCRDYLYRNPCSPLNSRTLNNNLYTALNKVPLPTGDSIRYEVELARIREEINDWIKELPLQPQNPTEVFARNKLVYILSKKLFDIEVEGTDNQLMKKEIVKFLNKMPLKSGQNNDILADKLIDKLKASEESRKYDASSNVTIDAFGNVSAASRGSGMDDPKHPKPFPPCNLSPEDRAHLERIKRRTCLSPSCLNTFMRRNKCNAGVGPRSVDAGSQTLLRPFGMEKQQSPICPVNNEKTPRPCPGLSANLEHPPCSHARRDPFEIEKPPPSPICPAAHEKTPRPSPAGPSRPLPQSGHQMRRHTISSSNIEYPRPDVQPQVIIKQYYWNPNEKNSIVDESHIQRSGSSRRQTDPVPCHQPGHQTGSAPCDQTRTSSYAQSTPAPYDRPSLFKLQQNTSPQRMPCAQSLTCPEPTSQHQPSPERYSYWDPQSSFQRPSQRDKASSRPSYTPSPCMSPFGLNQQSSPTCSSGFPKRDHECQMPKRDGLQDQMPCSSRPCRKERVIELGSLDDISNARPKKRHSDQSDWPFQEDDFWGVPMRRVILDEGINESVVMEREQREERIRCRCKERLIPKSGRSQPRTCPSQEIPLDNEDDLQRCSKCCGRQCPYPSFLYFRQ